MDRLAQIDHSVLGWIDSPTVDHQARGGSVHPGIAPWASCSVQGSIVQSRSGTASPGVEWLVQEYLSYQGLMSWSRGGSVSSEVSQSVQGLFTQSRGGPLSPCADRFGLGVECPVEGWFRQSRYGTACPGIDCSVQGWMGRFRGDLLGPVVVNSVQERVGLIKC